MRLLKLESDNPKFKTLQFNPGLNIIAGLQLSEEDKKTINGIGKSLSLNLIHYILGAGIKDKKLKQYLTDYGEFCLSFKHSKTDYYIRKNFSSAEFVINDKPYNSKEYPCELNDIFNFNSDVSFRQVFNCFARRHGGTYYTNALTQQGMGINDYFQRLVNLVLLGVNTDLVKDRFKTKEQIIKLNKASDIISDYEKELDKTNIKDIEDEIRKLKDQKNNFIIAKNYDLLKKEADRLTEEMNDLRNTIYMLEQRYKKKQENLEQSENINIDPDQIENIYHEAEFFFEGSIKKRLEDAQEFHNTLIRNRRKRLEKDISQIKIELSENEISLKEKSKQRDSILKGLDNSGALEEYNSLADRIKSLEEEKENLEKYKNILKDFKRDKTKLTTKNSQIREKSLIYIEETSDDFEKKENLFRVIVKQFYDNHGGSLELSDTKDAKYLYDIKVHVPKDGSQGVGEVKIFCYDALLYLLNKEPLGFMAHDGCVFSGMDPRQKSMIFKIILKLIRDTNLQYFINTNENSFKEILVDNNKILSDEEKEIMGESVILKLYDKNPENWLFGEAFG
jgi:uncharacterized protein YydD (DUF2326 family)